ncbi:S41 family peptidase [bacterium]|nr:MAG: S41 family peptidase [bacterium]
MSVKRFFYPNLLSALILTILFVTDVDSVFSSEQNPSRTHLQKYIQVQRQILDNYVDVVDIDELYKNSLKGLVSRMSDSTVVIQGTPLDTTNFAEFKVNDLRQSVMRFEQAYNYLSQLKPEEDMDKRTEDAIRFMFKDLDPHSIYIEKEDNERIQEEFDGKFQGIGVQFDIINDTITVVTPLTGGPSESIGIEAGDKIVSINDSSAVGFTNDKVVKNLRGPKGSKVRVGIKRHGVSDLIPFTIIRDDIPIYTVDASYMLDSKTGYIKVNRFARTTYDEFISAMKDLKAQGMTQLILDLRNNGGGFMDQALRIADEFLSSDMKLLSTRGRKSRFNQDFMATDEDAFFGKPMMILINEGSASASEIVSGAIQDHDLGLIVGRRSFGKGLVQQQYELVDGSSIRVTISKYYTPSGRLVQKPYFKGREDYAYELIKRSHDAMSDAEQFVEKVPDSLRYSTDAGRTVYGGGGIVPDHIVEDDTTQSAILGLMRRKRLDLEFVLSYMEKNGDKLNKKYNKDLVKFRKEFAFTDKDMLDFRNLLMQNGFVESDTTMKTTIRNDTLFAMKGTYEKERWIAEGFLKAYVARQVWGAQSFYQVYNDVFDTTLKEAMKLWGDVKKLQDYRASHVSKSK